MSCKNEKCCQSRPVAEMTMLPDWVVAQLLAVAQSGLKNILPWPSDSVRVLAEKIAALVAEVESLRKLLGVDKKSNPVIENGTLTFKFGPDNQYVLSVPVGDPAARKRLSMSLAGAAEGLQTLSASSESSQLDLPFSN